MILYFTYLWTLNSHPSHICDSEQHTIQPTIKIILNYDLSNITISKIMGECIRILQYSQLVGSVLQDGPANPRPAERNIFWEISGRSIGSGRPKDQSIGSYWGQIIIIQRTGATAKKALLLGLVRWNSLADGTCNISLLPDLMGWAEVSGEIFS